MLAGGASGQTSQQSFLPLLLSEDAKPHPLGPHLLMQEDPDGKVSPESIRRTNGAILNGNINQSKVVHLGYSGATYWLTFKLMRENGGNEWILDLGQRGEGRIGYLRELRLYALQQDGSGLHAVMIPPFKDGAYTLKIEGSEQQYFTMQVRSTAGRPATLVANIFSPEAYILHEQSRSAFNDFYTLTLIGFAIFFAAYALGFYQKKYAVYTVFYVIAALMWLSYNSIGAGSGSLISIVLMPAFTLILAILSVIITKIHWDIDETYFTERHVLNGLLWLNAASAVFSLSFPVYSGMTHTALFYGTPLLTLAIIMLMSLAKSQNGTSGHRIFFFSWACAFAGLVVTALASTSILPPHILFLNAFWFSLLPQGVLLAMASHEKIQSSEMPEETVRAASGIFDAEQLKQTKDNADHSRLLKVIEKERAVLAEFRAKEELRIHEMQKAKEEADEANRAKSAFLAVVSHEIRTPMTGVMGMVRMLLESNITKQQRDYALTIQESSEAMMGLLNDILDFEKIQQGKIELENISFDLHRLIHGAVTLMSGHAAAKNIGISGRMDDHIPRFVKGDPTRLRQVLLNLMGNAIKFTSQGEVTLTVRAMGAPDTLDGSPSARDTQITNKHTIYFAIQDSGIGIPAEAQKNLFNPFSQASSSIARKFGGTGLGLAISKGLVEMMGGNIGINSMENEGSTFFFTLEMDQGVGNITGTGENMPAQAGMARQRNAPARPMRILLVDDNAITGKVATTFLEKDGHEIVTCTSAEDALHAIEQTSFDMVFMDIELPGMHGNEAVRLIRGNPDPTLAALPVIAMTGNVGEDHIKAYMADGMTGFIGKPFDQETLRKIVHDIAQRPAANRAPPDAGQTAEAPLIEESAVSENTLHENLAEESALQEDGDSAHGQADKTGISFAAPQKPETVLERHAREEAFASGAESAPPHSSAAAPEKRNFNPDMLQSLKDAIGIKQLTDLLTELFDKTDEIVDAIAHAYTQEDMPALAARAHELKGMTGNFGLDEIAALAGQVESLSKANTPEGLEGVVAALPAARERGKKAVKEWAEQ
ncbi:MAG: ATP-binding protein [Micavibrio sp.]